MPAPETTRVALDADPETTPATMPHTTGGFTEIPRLDLSLANDPSTEPQLLSQLRYALTEVGFLYIENHGVSQAAVSDVIDALPILFALPDEAKAEVALDKSPHFLGYSGDGSETTAGKTDRREQFEFATELSATWEQGAPLAERLRGPNPVRRTNIHRLTRGCPCPFLTNTCKWPSAYPALRPIIEAYMDEMTSLGERFLDLVAKALTLPPRAFLPFLSEQHRLKLVHYPALPPHEAGNQGVGPHKDSSGWWTFLLQASPPHIKGLQVLNKSGDWVDVPVIQGSFVVNIGQAFEVITNGVCNATTHRVVGGPLERFSVPFFQGVRRDLTKEEAVCALKQYFSQPEFRPEFRTALVESNEGREIDSAFLKGNYDTWGESQLRTKIRSHQNIGRTFYGEVFEKYMSDD